MRSAWLPPWGRTETVDEYAGVLVPLEEAHIYSHSARTGKTEFESTTEEALDEEEGLPGKSEDDEGEGMLMMDAAEYTVEALRKEMRAGKKGGKAQWSDYEIKSKLINKAVQDIGIGAYNWQLFILCGFGWFADKEYGGYTTSALFVGLSAESFMWGIGSDVLGRHIAFNLTLLITSVFGISAAYAQSWHGVCFFAALGFGVGGNLPVDGALFLEFLPDASSALLTLLPVWWPVGQLASSLVAWYCITRWPVEQGRRYFVLTIGIATFAMFVVRFFLFCLLESPKFLLNKGLQDEAVAVVHGIAYRNGTKTWLTAAILDQVAADDVARGEPAAPESPLPSAKLDLLRDKLKGLSGDRLRHLFETKKLGLATVLIWFCWASIGMGYPLFNAFLPQYFSHQHHLDSAGEPPSETAPISDVAYRNFAITSVLGVPGSLLAAYLVDRPSPFLGRRGTLASSTLVSAVFLFLFVTFGTTSSAQLGFSCVEAFSQNIMYGVLYAFTPEVFPAPVRGAGMGVASFANRVTGLMAPVLAATVPGDGATTPIYISAVLILAAFVSVCLIPIETRGAQRL